MEILLGFFLAVAPDGFAGLGGKEPDQLAPEGIGVLHQSLCNEFSLLGRYRAGEQVLPEKIEPLPRIAPVNRALGKPVSDSAPDHVPIRGARAGFAPCEAVQALFPLPNHRQLVAGLRERPFPDYIQILRQNPVNAMKAENGGGL